MSLGRKWLIVYVISAGCFCVTACSSMVASTYPGVMKEFPNPGALALRSRPCWCSSYNRATERVLWANTDLCPEPFLLPRLQLPRRLLSQHWSLARQTLLHRSFWSRIRVHRWRLPPLCPPKHWPPHGRLHRESVPWTSIWAYHGGFHQPVYRLEMDVKDPHHLGRL